MLASHNDSIFMPRLLRLYLSIYPFCCHAVIPHEYIPAMEGEIRRTEGWIFFLRLQGGQFF